MKRLRPTLLMLILLLLVSLACNLVTGGDEPTAEPEVQPTVVPPTDIPPTDLPAPTDTPEPTPTEEPPPLPTSPPPTDEPKATEAPPPAAFELEVSPYSHPQGIFELYPPQGWDVESGEAGATFNAPDESGFINVEVTNTGVTLDGDSFERFVDARDSNFFGGFEDYEVTSRQLDKSNGVARVTKRLLFDGLPQTVFTLYDQHDQVIFSFDFWADEDLASAYGDKYEEIINTATVDGETAASDVDIYYWIFDFTGPADLFTIEVPIPWRYESFEDESAVVDVFYAPDEHAFIENIAYDEGEEISKAEAGAFALDLLKEFYATDIHVTDDRVQPDGSERLTWNSPSGEYSGISFLETRGTTFLLFSVVWDNPYEDVYVDTLDYTISSYEVPEG